MVKAKYGFYHSNYGPDMDGSNELFEWVEDKPMKDDPEPCQGWFAMCEVEPDAGLIGPFDTEAEATKAATNEEDFLNWMYSQMGEDPLGDHHGRNE